MGLDTSHDAFHGAYSAFNRLRQEVAHAAGGSHPPHFLRNVDGSIAHDRHGYPIRDATLDDDSVYLPDDCSDGLREFLTHSDCDGEISPEMCAQVADALEAVLPKISDHEAHGHLARAGGYRGAVEKFIAGCRLAAKRNEPLEFY